MRSISFTGSTHSPAILCFRSMAANTLCRAEPSLRAFKSNASAARGSDCGRPRSWAPRSAETTLADSRKRIRCAQDNAALEGAALTKSRDSRPPKSRGAEVEKAIGRASLKEPRTESVPVRITSKNYHNGYREKSVLYPYFAVTFGRQ